MALGTKLGVIALSGAGSAFSNVYSINFDGVDDYCEGASDFESFDGATQASISFWFKTQATTQQEIITQWDASSNDNRNLRILFIPSSTRVDIYVGQNIAYRASSTTINTDTWYHGVFTYNGGNTGNQRVKFYLNASSQSQIGFSGPTTMKSNPASPLTVGARTAYAFNEFNGNIDEVSVFDAELDADQVTSIYNSGAPGDLTGHANLIHWWRMGDGDTYPTLTDNVGSYDLTMTNMASGDIEENVPS
jgi:ribosomal protein L35AE/L33A